MGWGFFSLIFLQYEEYIIISLIHVYRWYIYFDAIFIVLQKSDVPECQPSFLSDSEQQEHSQHVHHDGTDLSRRQG